MPGLEMWDVSFHPTSQVNQRKAKSHKKNKRRQNKHKAKPAPAPLAWTCRYRYKDVLSSFNCKGRELETAPKAFQQESGQAMACFCNRGPRE